MTYVLLTRSPLNVLLHLDRLACIRHAASVHPEPGSNSQNLYFFVCFFCFLAVYIWFLFLLKFYWRCLFIFLLSFQRSVAASLSPRDSLFIITYLLLSCQLLFLSFLNIFLNIFLVFFSFFCWLYLFNHIVLPLSSVFLSFFIFLFFYFLSFLLLALCAHTCACMHVHFIYY